MQTISFLSLLLLFSVLKTHTNAQEIPKYVKVPTGFLMVLRQGDDVFAELEKLAVKEKIPSANLSGMGFVNVKFGFFNFDTKEYDPKEFKKVELASMSGTIAWKDGKPSLHCHGTVTGKDFTAHGGHMLAATVSTGSVEIIVTVHDKKLERVTEQPLGANVLSLE
ncbi:PPC domain-containing DNA-binding protein [Dyadobacter sp. CY347]|uniref:PPC domain-containing DNA-binding protein n=1 Tax=Dyadobacter sp. CY347 TaxID=2909336 RepID=UPI001F440F28|nr:PPC domain-containing DNA-binding protein [Dyadobacter sp. CY347]MCF2491067.1 DNA-binding protein [Dyadobacter sp. CY347]